MNNLAARLWPWRFTQFEVPILQSRVQPTTASRSDANGASGLASPHRLNVRNSAGFSSLLILSRKAPEAAADGSRPCQIDGVEELDSQWMRRLQEGDTDALQYAIERYKSALARHIRGLLKNGPDTIEVVSEAFEKVYHHRLEYDSRFRFSTWLYAIATNLARSRLRWQKRQPPLVPLPQSQPLEEMALDPRWIQRNPAPDQILMRKEWEEALESGITALPQELQQAVRWFVFEGQSQAAIARALGCSVKTIEMRLYDARKRLHRFMEHWARDGALFFMGAITLSSILSSRFGLRCLIDW